MMFQVPVILGLLCLFAPSIAEDEVSGKETHQVYSYSYHFQHNGSADPKQFLQQFLPDPPEGGSAVRTFFNPHLRGFISKGYLPAGPAKNGRSTFARSPQLPTFEGIKNLVDQKLKNFQPPSPPEFSPLPPSIEKNIVDVNNDISNNLLSDNRGHNVINHLQNSIPEIPNPVSHNRPLVPPPLPPPPPPPASVNDVAIPNDGVTRNVKTFQKDLPDGKIFEKIETISFNPPQVSNFNSQTQNFNDGGVLHTRQFNNQNQHFGYRSTSYFRKEHRTGTPNAENFTPNNAFNNELGVGGERDNPRHAILLSSNGPRAGNGQNSIVPLGPLKLLIIPAVDKINNDINDNNLNNIRIPPQQITINPRKPANGNHGTAGFGVRLRRPVAPSVQTNQHNQLSRPPQSQPQPQHPVPHNRNFVGANNLRIQPPAPANVAHQNPNQFLLPGLGHQNAQINQHPGPVHGRSQDERQNFNARVESIQDQFRNNINAVRSNSQNTGRNSFSHQPVSNGGRDNGFGYNDRTADRIINTVNEKLRHIDDQFNSISREKPGIESGSPFVWDDDNRDWNPFPQMEWGNRIQSHGDRPPPVQNNRPFSNGHSGPVRGPPRNNQGDTHTMNILRHTLEALVGRKLDIPVIPENPQNNGNFHDVNGGGVEKVFATDRVVEGPNSFSRNHQRGFERNFQVNSNTGFQRVNQWSTDTAKRLDTQSSSDDFRRDYIDVFADDI